MKLSLAIDGIEVACECVVDGAPEAMMADAIHALTYGDNADAYDPLRYPVYVSCIVMHDRGMVGAWLRGDDDGPITLRSPRSAA